VVALEGMRVGVVPDLATVIQRETTQSFLFFLPVIIHDEGTPAPNGRTGVPLAQIELPKFWRPGITPLTRHLAGLRTVCAQAITSKPAPGSRQLGGLSRPSNQSASQDRIARSRARHILIRASVHALDANAEVAARGKQRPATQRDEGG
jgi:hypothetical protein